MMTTFVEPGDPAKGLPPLSVLERVRPNTETLAPLCVRAEKFLSFGLLGFYGSPKRCVFGEAVDVKKKSGKRNAF
jgi:hypothetical protein